MDRNTIVEVIHKMVGNTEPVGDSIRDAEALKNTTVLIDVVDLLLGDICMLRNYASSDEGSVQKVGQVAYNFIAEYNRNGIG